MKKTVLLITFMVLFVSGLVSAMGKEQKKRCCYGGLGACLRRNVTTPIWFSWHEARLRKEFKEAVDNDNAQKVTEVIAHGVNPNGYREWGGVEGRFLARGVKNGCMSAVTALLDGGLVPEVHEIQFALETPDCSKDLQDRLLGMWIELQVASGKSFGSDRYDPLNLLCCAIKNGTQDQVARLLYAGVPINETCYAHGQSSTPLECAVKERKDELLPFLLECDAKITRTALLHAIKIGDISLFEYLARSHPEIAAEMLLVRKSLGQALRNVRVKQGLERSEWLSSDNDIPCYDGLIQAEPHMIEYLCNLYVDPNVQRNYGQTALWQVENYAKLRALLKCGAWVELEDKDGQTVVHYCAQNGKRKKLKVLLTYPRLSAAKELPEVKEAVFTFLCCLKRYCLNVPVDMRLRLLRIAFGDELYVVPLGKFIKRIPLEQVIERVPFGIQYQLTKKYITASGDEYGPLLDKDALVQEYTRAHMVFIKYLLQLPDGVNRLAWQLAQDEKLKDQLYPDIIWHNYHWRARVEREYRYLFDTGILYQPIESAQEEDKPKGYGFP